MKNKKIILGLIGEMACGKGAIAKYAKEKYGASTYLFSDMLRDVMNRLHIEISRKNLTKTSKMLRDNFGEDIMAKVIYNDVKNDKNKIIIVDGIRRIPDIKYLKKLPEFKLVRVVVDSKIRYGRLTKRGQNAGDSKKTFKQFLKDHELETEVDIPKIMKKANLEINNEGSWDELKKQVDNILK